MGWLAWIVLLVLGYFAMKHWDKQVAERDQRDSGRDDKLRRIEERVACLEEMGSRISALERSESSSQPYYGRSTLDDDD
jgi:hypothetical protein